MVKELNKPQDNAALSEILDASNRQLLEMQEEHRQLQAELTRLSAQRQQLRMATRVQESMSSETTSTSIATSSESSEGAAAVQAADTADEKDEDKEETASYLQQKLAEIANLKAQFKRVQNITENTKLIEERISSMESKSSTSSSSVQQSRQTMSAETVQAISSSTSSTSNSSSSTALASETATSGAPTARTAPDNAELINAMINMVTDFTSDLRGQEESLREERLRIKTLKEEIIQRKQGK